MRKLELRSSAPLTPPPVDDAKHLARARLRIMHLEAQRGCLQQMLQAAQIIVCSHMCASVWNTGEERPHCDLCRSMRAVLEQDEHDTSSAS
jgi:hypothetical protein